MKTRGRELWAEWEWCVRRGPEVDRAWCGSQTDREARSVVGPGCVCGCVGEPWRPTSRFLDAIQFSSRRLLIVGKRLDCPLSPTLSQHLVL